MTIDTNASRGKSAVGSRSLLLVPLGAAAIVAGAQWTFPLPGTDLPQTGQTLAVLLTGTFLGRAHGTAATLLYLGLAALGLPVLAGGASGIEALSSRSAGYLWSFLPAAFLAGMYGERTARSSQRRETGDPVHLLRFLETTFVMALLHALILVMGAGWLATFLGLRSAIEFGVEPFLWGGAVKSILIGFVVTGVRRVRE